MNNLNGILLVLASMAAFAIEDSFIKLMTQSLPTPQVIVTLGAFGTVLFAIGAAYKRERIFAPISWTRVPLLRALAEGLAGLFFMTALSRVELSTVAAVFQATPLVITMGAALFMGESVGWRRWSAIATGFLGVLLIIRPGFEGFNPDALYVLFSVLCVAFRDLITRRISPQVGTMTVSLQAFFAVLLSGLILFIATGTTPVLPTATLNAYTFGAALFGGVGVYGIVQAMRVAEASAVQPFRYSRLVFSMLLGMILFAERPDLLTYLGSALIIASGLYTFFRERRFTP